MNEFVVSGEGRVRETSVQDSIQRLKDMFPDLDASAWEAQVMLERTHRLLANLRDAHWTKYGLTGRRFILLRLLYTTPHKRLSMSEIASHMNLAPNNVTVNCVCPGATDTPMSRIGFSPDQFKKREEIPPLMDGLTHKFEIVGLVRYLLSDAAKYITGQTFFLRTPK